MQDFFLIVFIFSCLNLYLKTTFYIIFKFFFIDRLFFLNSLFILDFFFISFFFERARFVIFSCNFFWDDFETF